MKRIFIVIPLLVLLIASGCKKNASDITFSMSFTESEYTIEGSDSKNLSKYLVFEPEGADTVTVNWSSSNEDLAIVSKNGWVTTSGINGSATITATSHGVTASCKIKVIPVIIESYKLADKVENVYFGEVVEIPISNVTPSNASISDLTWESSNPSVMPYYESINSRWVIKACMYSTVKLTSHYEGLADQVCSIPVNFNTIESIELSPLSPAMLFESTLQVTTNIKKKNNDKPLTYDENLVWSSSNGSVASVSKDGVITSKSKEGSCTITCTHNAVGPGDKSASASITVNVTKEEPITSFDLDRKTLSLKAGASGTVNVISIVPATTSASYIQWKSSDNSMVSVSANGKICTIKSVNKDKTGKCTVTASVNGIERKVDVTVESNPIKSITIESKNGFVLADGKTKYTFKYDIQPADATIASIGAAINRTNASEFVTTSIDRVNKTITAVFIRGTIDSFSSPLLAQMQLFVRDGDGVQEKIGTSAQFYVVPTHILEDEDAYRNIYGCFMEKSTISLWFNNYSSLYDWAKDCIYITDVTHSDGIGGGAVQPRNKETYKSSYSNKDGIELIFTPGSYRTEYTTNIKYKYAFKDVNGSFFKSETKTRLYRNLIEEYTYETKEGGVKVEKEVFPGGTIELKTQKNSSGQKVYERVVINIKYRKDYMEKSDYAIDSMPYIIFSSIESSKYNDFAGKTISYKLCNTDEFSNVPVFKIHFNK